MTVSRGAWPFFYSLGLDHRGDPNGRDAHGIYALKDELIHNGYGHGIDRTLAYWGGAAVAQTKLAQAHFGIHVDGVLGPTTARSLFRKRIAEAEAVEGLPPHLLARIATLESADDPVAQGWVDPDDEGLFQENLPSNPALTQTQCWTPSYIVPYAAHQLASRVRACAGSVKAATAAWNIGNYEANKWRLAGFPSSGGDNNVYERATGYVAKVNGEPL